MAIFISGVVGAALLFVGSNLVVPVGIEVGSFIELAGVGSMMVCFGLADGDKAGEATINRYPYPSLGRCETNSSPTPGCAGRPRMC
jgi:hypothetical protein